MKILSTFIFFIIIGMMVSFAYTPYYKELQAEAQSHEDIDALMEEGTIAFLDGKYDIAISFFDKVLEIEPDNIFALSDKGLALINLGNYEEAIVYFDKILEIKPDNIFALSDKGLALINLGNYEEAKVYFERILEIDPNFEDVLKSKKELLEITTKPHIPDWFQNNAKWWSDGQISDSDFINSIQFLILEDIISIPDLPERASEITEGIPHWIRNGAGQWADGKISDEHFIMGIKYFVEQGIIKI